MKFVKKCLQIVSKNNHSDFYTVNLTRICGLFFTSEMSEKCANQIFKTKIHLLKGYTRLKFTKLLFFRNTAVFQNVSKIWEKNQQICTTNNMCYTPVQKIHMFRWDMCIWDGFWCSVHFRFPGYVQWNTYTGNISIFFM